MKIDDIIKELRSLEGELEYTTYLSQFAKLMRELAEHVKAQEPEPFTEEDIMLANQYDQENKNGPQV